MSPEDSSQSLKQLQERLGFCFQQPSLLKQALTHPSYLAEDKSESIDNQRLEFLGDAVLQLALTEELYRNFEGENEGVLTKWRSRLVSRPALANFATVLELGPAMLMGKGEEMNGGRLRASTLSDCMEAVLGAIYLDGGFQEAARVILGLAAEALKTVVNDPESGNPKGLLQEILQAIRPESPHYEILHEEGPEHRKHFQAKVSWAGVLLGSGEGASKKAAEIASAADALEKEAWQVLDGKSST